MRIIERVVNFCVLYVDHLSTETIVSDDTIDGVLVLATVTFDIENDQLTDSFKNTFY